MNRSIRRLQLHDLRYPLLSLLSRLLLRVPSSQQIRTLRTFCIVMLNLHTPPRGEWFNCRISEPATNHYLNDRKEEINYRIWFLVHGIQSKNTGFSWYHWFWLMIIHYTLLYLSVNSLLLYVHCIKSELYLAKWKWILRSGPKLKMLVKFHRSNGSFPNLLNWWRIRFGCTALDQCYWNKENWFAIEPDLLLAKYFYNWYFTFMPS